MSPKDNLLSLNKYNRSISLEDITQDMNSEKETSLVDISLNCLLRNRREVIQKDYSIQINVKEINNNSNSPSSYVFSYSLRNYFPLTKIDLETERLVYIEPIIPREEFAWVFNTWTAEFGVSKDELISKSNNRKLLQYNCGMANLSTSWYTTINNHADDNDPNKYLGVVSVESVRDTENLSEMLKRDLPKAIDVINRIHYSLNTSNTPREQWVNPLDKGILMTEIIETNESNIKLFEDYLSSLTKDSSHHDSISGTIDPDKPKGRTRRRRVKGEEKKTVILTDNE